MRLKTILLIILLVFSFNFYGQISLTTEHNTPKPEYIYKYISVDFDFDSYIYPGIDTIWNIANPIINNDTLKRFFTRDSTYISFPGYYYNPEICPPPDPRDTSILRTANTIFRISETEMYHAYEIFYPPDYSGISAYIGETYIPYLKFPFQFNDSMDAGSYNYHDNGYMWFKRAWKMADSYGKLNWQDTTYNNVLRVYSYTYLSEGTVHDGIDFYTHKYEWYNEDYQLPILFIEFNEYAWFSDGIHNESFDSTAYIFDSKQYITPSYTLPAEPNHKYLEVFPSPANDRIFINSNKSIISIKLLDLHGKVILSINEQDMSSINVSYLTNGFYILFAQFEDGIYLTKKIIITK